MKPFVLNALRISVYQIIYMEKVPNAAVCNEAVKLIKKRGLAGLAPFVNGVLRNIIRGVNNLAIPNKEDNILEHLSIKYSCPKWIVEYWLLEFDLETVENICKANQTIPRISICVNTLKTNKQELKLLLEQEGVEVSEFNNENEDLFYISKTSNMANLKAFKEGLFHVIDESSANAVKTLDPKKGETIIDVCSAPGGKAFYCSHLMENTGDIICCDIHEHKLKIVEENAKRLGIKNIKTVLKDATIKEEKPSFLANKILIDAPCSGFGLFRKKPDIKYSKSLEDIKKLWEIQQLILSASEQYVEQGGKLVYCTCTVSKTENLDNAVWFANNFNFDLEYIKQYLPKQNGHDGFFICSFIRR